MHNNKQTVNEYNKEPVFYCEDCLSLKIYNVDGLCYCDKCGSTNVGRIDIFTWERLYAERYAGNYINMK